MSVKVRFAPSPTGTLHVGGVRTALFNYLFAKKQGGEIFLRIEDTDKERSKREYEQGILDSFEWLGLEFDDFEDQQLIRQSERGDLYRQALEKLLESGAAYVSKEKVKKEGPSTALRAGKRAEVIRFKNPGSKVTFTDLIRGEISFDTAELGDFVIAKSLDEPLYHLAVVVDDATMGLTHVIRGEEHISNTPRQILLIEALGAKRPEYAHFPLILAADRSKLSKRHGSVSVMEYRDEGYLPEAVINFLATLGWSPQAAGLKEEVLSLDELIKYFDLAHIQKGGAIFNLEKLDWFNREYIKRLPEDELLMEMEKHFPGKDREILKKLLPEITPRITNFSDLNKQSGAGEWDYFFEAPKPDKELLKTPETLEKTIELLKAPNADEFTAEKIKEAVWDYAEQEGKAKILWPMRVALSGRSRSADPFTIATIIGKEETIKRLKHAKGL